MQNLNVMQILLLAGLFAVVFAGALVALLVFVPRNLERRLQQACGGTVALCNGNTPADGAAAWVAKFVEISKPISKLSLPKEGWEESPLRVRLMNAGWRTPNAASIYFAAKTILAIILPTVLLPVLIGTRLAGNRYTLAMILVLVAAIGYYLPNVVLSRRIASRQRVIF